MAGKVGEGRRLTVPRAKTDAPVDKGKGKSTAPPEDEPEADDDDDDEDDEDELIVRGSRKRKTVDYASVSGDLACRVHPADGARLRRTPPLALARARRRTRKRRTTRSLRAPTTMRKTPARTTTPRRPRLPTPRVPRRTTTRRSKPSFRCHL